MTEARIALDRASVRRLDIDGHLHVADSNLSKANVCPYRGSEIPDYEKLGLDAHRIYQLYRDPVELAKGASTFSGKPLLSLHKPVTATDHAHRLTVGSVNNVRFDSPYLRGSLVVWDADAIAGIESGDQKELSCGYRYRAVPGPGVTPDGVRFDMRMVDIQGNHVALVESGRAGHDVIVGDAALVLSPLAPASPRLFIVKGPRPMQLSRMALLSSGALRVFLAPKLAQDAKIDLAPILKNVRAKNWKQDKPKIKTALDAALAGKLATDATLNDLVSLLDQLDEPAAEIAETPEIDPAPPADIIPATGLTPPTEPETLESDPLTEDGEIDAQQRVAEFLTGKISDEDLAAVMTLLKPEVDPPEPAPAAPATDAIPPAVLNKEKNPMITKAAMDAAIAASAKQAEKAAFARFQAIREAEKLVRPIVGELALAQDSAEAVFKIALDNAEVDLAGVPTASYGPMVKLLLKMRADAPARPLRVATDAATDKALLAKFPGLNSLKVR